VGRSFDGQTEVGLNRVSQAFDTEGTDAFFQRSKDGGPLFGSRWKCREKTRQIGRDGQRQCRSWLIRQCGGKAENISRPGPVSGPAQRAPEYPGRFLDDCAAVTYFTRYFTWYDTEHYHSGIDFVTPQQAHQGLRWTIVEERRAKALSQRRRRQEENQRKSGVQKTKNQGTTTD